MAIETTRVVEDTDAPTSLGDDKIREVYGFAHHGFPMWEALAFDAQYTVDLLPRIDHAARALHKAQEDYLQAYPNARLDELVWTIRAQ